jgi:sigma-B regulation protein RsbU (phosphoserine phosphatase)
MDETFVAGVRAQLMARRRRLESAIDDRRETARLSGLLREVDLALERVADGTYGICETCGDPIEEELLGVDPLASFCLAHLDSNEQRALERDLELAARIQAALLPKNDIVTDEWRVHYHYEGAGLVSGDYCDMVPSEGGGDGLLFVLGDVSGKGVAASMLMSHLHAVFHSLVSFDLSVDQLMERANRLLCESTMSTHFATLVCGKASGDGRVEVCNAGHIPPLLFQGDEAIRLEATGIPAGVMCNTTYPVKEVRLARGDRLVLYTDGLSEATSGASQYGDDRVSEIAMRNAALPPDELVKAMVADLDDYTSGAPRQDDLTILVIQRTA